MEEPTKRCGRCTENVSLSEFGKNRSRTDGLQSECKACRVVVRSAWYEKHKDSHNSRVRDRAQEKPAAKLRRKRNREFVADYLRAHPCVDCGETDIVVLQFDHQGNKTAQISDLLQRECSLKRIQDEIAKCEVVCANDHARRTARAFGWSKAAVLELSTRDAG